MHSPEPPSPLDDFPLDISGQQERINRLYTQVTFCFPLSDDARKGSHSRAIESLAQGLSRLTAAFPWIAGRVVRDRNGEFNIKPSLTQLQQPLLIQDLRGNASMPTWADFQKNQFPFSMLDEDAIAPCKTLAEPGAELPVLLVQANLIKGGLLLTVNAQHGSMDMGGQAQVVSLLAKAMRGEEFHKDEIEGGNVNRRDVIPLLEGARPSEAKAKEEEAFGTIPSDAGLKAASAPHSSRVWAYLAFPRDCLTRIKSVASEDIPRDTFISADDALTAFVWQAVSRAREPRLPDLSARTTLTRNVDARKHLNLPPTYPGFITTATSHTSSIDDLIYRRSLGSIAAELRAALQDANSLKHGLQLQTASIARDRKEGTEKSISATGNPHLDVRLSSWAKEAFYDMDFGPVFGKPAAVRRPRFQEGAREGLVYFLPRTRDGEIVVGICLVEEDMQRLKRSPQVTRWSRWIG